jgi:hypothetical protein
MKAGVINIGMKENPLKQQLKAKAKFHKKIPLFYSTI